MPDGRVTAFAAIAEVPDLEVGNEDVAFKHVQDFLTRFGYLGDEAFVSGVVDEASAHALTTFQERNAVTVSGVLDTETRNAMTTARCGLPDLKDGLAFSVTCRWDHTNLSYAFDHGTADVPGNGELDAVRNAFATWAAAAPFTFAEVTTTQNPDILIDWRNANDPDHTMVGGVLAHSDFPPGCSVIAAGLPKPLHFDDSENTWSVGAAADAYDVETVALHEVGHLLGMLHTTVNGSVMFPSVSANFTLRTLQADDLAGIEQLYPQLPTGPAPHGDRMNPGDVLLPGQGFHSAGGRYWFVYQTDGNLVLYDGARALWASGTDGRPLGACIMQTDGNLVIYAPTGTKAIWATGTWHDAGSSLVVQDDGNVVIYRPNGSVAWSPNTWIPTGPSAQGDRMDPGQVLIPNQAIHSVGGRFTFVYQDDGNLVLYDGGRALWATGTNGRGVGVAIMQTDGNLVVYGRGGKVFWSSGTWHDRGSALVVQTDGNVVVYRPNGSAAWATGTNH